MSDKLDDLIAWEAMPDGGMRPVPMPPKQRLTVGCCGTGWDLPENNEGECRCGRMRWCTRGPTLHVDGDASIAVWDR